MADCLVNVSIETRLSRTLLFIADQSNQGQYRNFHNCSMIQCLATFKLLFTMRGTLRWTYALGADELWLMAFGHSSFSPRE